MATNTRSSRSPGKRSTRYESEAPPDARAAWLKLAKKKKLEIAAELVVSRASELRLAFPSALGIAYGFRTSGEKTGADDHASRRRRAAKRTVDHDDVCVTFMVQEKQKPSSLSAAGSNAMIPSFLLAYCTLGTARKLCAVPTNVECKTNYSIKPHTTRAAILVDDGLSASPTTFERGVITCVVNLPDGTGPYAMGCHHVLALSVLKGSPLPGTPIKTARTSVRLGDAQPGDEICKLSNYRGRLASGGQGFSFDSALGKVSNAAALALVASQGPEAAQDNFGVPGTAKIVTPRGNVNAKLVNVWHGFDLIEYLPAAPQPVQERVVEWAVEPVGAVQAGDSGSPVVRSNDDGLLLGMYIGGDGINRAFMLPAPEILDAKNYGLSGDLTLLSAS